MSVSPLSMRMHPNMNLQQCLIYVMAERDAPPLAVYTGSVMLSSRLASLNLQYEPALVLYTSNEERDQVIRQLNTVARRVNLQNLGPEWSVSRESAPTWTELGSTSSMDNHSPQSRWSSPASSFSMDEDSNNSMPPLELDD